MRRKKIWMWGGFLAVLGILGWHYIAGDPVTRLQHRYGTAASVNTAAMVSGGTVLTQENLLVSNGVFSHAEPQGEGSAEEALYQVPTRENGWVAANTTQGIDDLARSESAILLRNARIDTKSSAPLVIPSHLMAGADPGCYIVQSKGNITREFYQQLEEAGVQVISYIPNNAVLVSMTPEQANANGELFASILPYHPYYKLDSELLTLAMGENEKPFHAGTIVQLAVTPGREESFTEEVRQEGLTILSKGNTQFGQVVMLQPDKEQVIALAQSPNVHLMGVCHPKALANDHSMVRIGITTNELNTDSYLGLTGKDILVNVNDSMVDDKHPALAGRVFFAEDEDGKRITPLNDQEMAHGTHVMGTILGDGAESASVAGNADGSPEESGLLFKGAATNATALYLPIYEGVRSTLLDSAIIYWAAETNYIARKRTNVLISNNSWNFAQTEEYDLSAAVFDGAVRDAMEDVSGSQPMLFVFSAGNEGHGDTEGGTGDAGTILSPATGKNVITVGALETSRHVTVAHTNEVVVTNYVDETGAFEVVTNLVVTTNSTLYKVSDDEQQVANYSSRGNVGIGKEGSNGRRKPDVVATGSFIVSTKGQTLKDETPETYEDIQLYTDQFLDYGATNNYAFFGQTNLVSLKIDVIASTNTDTMVVPDVKIYLKKGARPTLYDYVGDNSYSTNFVVNANVDKEDESGNDNIPAEGEAGWSSGYGDWYLSLVGLDLMTTSYELVITLEMTYGDEEKAYYEDLASASEKLGEYYRYESGTSMAAAAVTGSLLLVQEFFETYAPAGVTTPSPALLKALLINGSNPAGNRYSRKEPYGVNYQGWGVPNMTNIIPAALTNSADKDSWPLWFIDQSVSNALATGESWEQTVTVPTNFNEGNMKVTLVWTDPAGNPVSAIKLVNDLDLIVSNKVTKAVYVGNDFQVNSDYNNAHKVSENTTTNSSSSTGDTNTQSFLSGVDTARDFVNNVETVVIKGPLDTNYVISVQARRVNVNAVTAHKDGIVQDFALTVAFQNAPADYFNSTNKFEVKDDNGILGTNLWRAPVDIVTNSVAMLQQRVGANTPLVTGSVTNRMTNGVESQWHFYVFTNVWWTNSATPSTNSSANPGEGEEDEPRPVERVSVGGPNVAFATFLPPNMASPSRLNNADLDMYVSTNSALTNIDADVIAEAVEKGWASRKQGGSELFYITNALENQVFYVGIKSEDQKAAEYGFVGISSQDPFDENDNGNHLIRFNPGSAWVPDGSADEPGGTYLFAIATDPVTVRSVFITNTYLAQNPGDLYVALSHSSGSVNDNVVVLHNHSFFDDVLDPIETNEVVIAYNDNGLTGKNVRTSDGPGSLMDFEGYDGSGLWLLTLVDNALNHTNRVGSSLYIVQRYDNAWFTLSPFSFMYHSFDVEDDVIAVNITISEIDPEYPLEAYILKDVRPTLRDYDYKETVNPPGRTITISRDDIPALETGRYWLGMYNPNAVDVRYQLNIEYVHGFTIGDDQGKPSKNTPLTLVDDAYSTYEVVKESVVEPGEDGDKTNKVDVIRDSVITVDDDRDIKNVNVGVRIDHPRISDLSISLVSPAGTSVLLSENRGWGATNANPNEVDLIPNEKNDSVYGSGTTNTALHYAFFSSDTNYALLPIKFQLPPYTNDGKGRVVYQSTFEDAKPAVYNITNNALDSGDFQWMLSGSTNTNIVWDEDLEVMLTNLVTQTNFRTWVWDDPTEAYQGTNFIIANRTVLMTTFSNLMPDTNYIFRVPFKRPRPLEGLITWWRANNDYLDTEWNLPLEPASGYSWPQFDTNGLEGIAFGMTNACLTGKSPNILSTIRTNFTIEGWFKMNQDIVQTYASRAGGPTMPLFEFTQLITNFWTNIVVKDDVEVEEVYMDVERVRGMSAWMKGTIWTNGYQRWLPHGTMMLELGRAEDGQIVSTMVNLANATATPTTDEYLQTFTNWVHLAISFQADPNGDVLRIYSNGKLMKEESWSHGYITPNTIYDFNLGYGNELGYSIGTAPVYYPGTFTGSMDEFSWYSRALEEEEIQEIADASTSGKAGMAHPPISVPIRAKVTLRQLGGTTNLFEASLPDITEEWQVGKARFQTPPLEYDEDGNEIGGTNMIYEVVIDVTRGAVAFDDLSVTTQGIAYEPEVSLNNLRGQNAKGDWTLLIQDTRVGATNPVPALVSWTLDLGYTATNVKVIDLTEENNFSYSGKLRDNEETRDSMVTYFRVFVPQWASSATNILTGSADMLMAGRWSGIPRFDRGLDDYLWLYNTPQEMTNYVITTNISSQAPLIPGGRYYLALRNQPWSTNTTTYDLKVDFGKYDGGIPEGVITLTNSVPYIVDPENGGGTNSVDYYHFSVSEEAVAASFMVYDATTNMTMVIGRGLPLPTEENHDYRSATGNLGYAQVMIYTNSMPVALTAGDWFIGVYNGAYSSTEKFDPASYKIVVTEYTSEIPAPEELSSGRPVSKTLEPGETHYYLYYVSTNAISLWTELDEIEGGNLNLYSKFGLPLPSATSRFYEFLDIDPETGLDWWLTMTTEPYPLRFGGWYYAVENTNSVAVTYRIRATEFSADPSSIIWLKNGISETNTVGLLPDGNDKVYYGFDVSENAVGSLFEIFNRTNGNVMLYTMPGKLPDPRNYYYWYLSSEGLTNSYTRLSSWSGELTPGYWFFAAMNEENQDIPVEEMTPATYEIRASEFETPDESSIVNLVNDYPVRVNNAPMYSESYFRYTTSANPTKLTFTITNVTDMVSVYLLDASPADGPRVAVYQLSWVSWFGAQIVLDLEESAVPLRPGDWYVVVENTSVGSVGYDIWASEEGSAEIDQPIDIGFEYDPETGLVTLVWASEIDAVYAIQGTYNAFENPIKWEAFDQVTATETVTRYPLTRELMEKYVFFSVRLVSKPDRPVPENITTFVNFDGLEETLNISWTAKLGSIYTVEGKKSVDDTDWTALQTEVNQVPLPIYSNSIDSEYKLIRVTPEGGVTTDCIHTAASYDTDTGEIELRWNSVIGSEYIVKGWTNLGDLFGYDLAQIVAETEKCVYRLKLEEAEGCAWFSIAKSDTDEEIDLRQEINFDTMEVVLRWNAIIGNKYRISASKDGVLHEIDTVVADSVNEEYKVSLTQGSQFYVTPLGKADTDPDPQPGDDLALQIRLVDGVVIIVVESKAGDVLELFYSDDTVIWNPSGGQHSVTQDGPYEITIPFQGNTPMKYFRVKRTR